jgi:hypothetical protein
MESFGFKILKQTILQTIPEVGAVSPYLVAGATDSRFIHFQIANFVNSFILDLKRFSFFF